MNEWENNNEKEEEKRHQEEIKRGERLASIEFITEGLGKQFKDGLVQALLQNNKKEVLVVLKKVGDTIHARFGSSMPTKPQFEEDEEAYKLNLLTGTGGTRIMINTRHWDYFPGDLIFPNVRLLYKNKEGLTLADVFEELFGDLAENIQPESNTPYYVVRLAPQNTED